MNRSTRRRHGGVYVFVLGSSMMVAVIGMSAIALTQVGARSVTASNDAAEASALAESAVELGLAKIIPDSAYQTDYPVGTTTTPLSVGNGTVSFKWATTSSPANSIRLYGIGKVRNATRVYSIQAASGGALTCLAVPAVGGTLSLSGTIAGGVTISSGSGGIAAGTTVFSSATTLESSGTISPSSAIANVTKVTLPSARTMPDTTHVFDTYKAAGTQIPLSALALSGVTRQLKWALLAPGINTLAGGTANAQGIYWIDCSGLTPITIQNIRVVGTLLILNPGSGSTINGADYFAPATAGYPSLMVKGGSMTISPTSATLTDSSVNSINFNQTGAAYGGTTDSTYTTSYPSRFEGIVYSSGSLSISNVGIQGVIAANNTLTVGTGVTMTYDSSIYSNPPAGFVSSTQMATLPGTWQWEPAP